MKDRKMVVTEQTIGGDYGNCNRLKAFLVSIGSTLAYFMSRDSFYCCISSYSCRGGVPYKDSDLSL